MHVVAAFFSEYLFFLSGIYFLLVFLATLFFLRNDRPAVRSSLMVAIVFAVITPFVERICLTDWWHPVFVNPSVPFEDFLFGFAIAGCASGIYFLLRRFLRDIPLHRRMRMTSKMLVVVGAPIVFLTLFYVFRLSSFWSSSAALCFVIVYGIGAFPRLASFFLMTGVVLMVVAFPGYVFGSYLHPGWITQYWILKGVPARLVLGIPLGEYAYYFLSGSAVAVLQEMFFK